MDAFASELRRYIATRHFIVHLRISFGTFLLGRLGDALGAPSYCPSTKSRAYVVLHTPASRIFGIAYGQRGLALRLTDAAHSEALTDGGIPIPAIGSQWVRFDPWKTPHLRRRAERSFADAATK